MAFPNANTFCCQSECTGSVHQPDDRRRAPYLYLAGFKPKYLSEVSEVDVARWFGISESEAQAFEEKYRAVKEKYAVASSDNASERQAPVTNAAGLREEEDAETRDRREWERWELWKKIYRRDHRQD